MPTHNVAQEEEKQMKPENTVGFLNFFFCILSVDS